MHSVELSAPRASHRPRTNGRCFTEVNLLDPAAVEVQRDADYNADSHELETALHHAYNRKRDAGREGAQVHPPRHGHANLRYYPDLRLVAGATRFPPSIQRNL